MSKPLHLKYFLCIIVLLSLAGCMKSARLKQMFGVDVAQSSKLIYQNKQRPTYNPGGPLYASNKQFAKVYDRYVQQRVSKGQADSDLVADVLKKKSEDVKILEPVYPGGRAYIEYKKKPLSLFQKLKELISHNKKPPKAAHHNEMISNTGINLSEYGGGYVSYEEDDLGKSLGGVSSHLPRKRVNVNADEEHIHGGSTLADLSLRNKTRGEIYFEDTAIRRKPKSALASNSDEEDDTFNCSESVTGRPFIGMDLRWSQLAEIEPAKKPRLTKLDNKNE